MTKFLRLAAGVLGLGVLALGIAASDLVYRHVYHPSGNNADFRSPPAEELLRQERLKQWKEATFGRLEAKRDVAVEVIARRCSLAEAIAQFRVLDEQWPRSRPQMQMPRGLTMPEDEWDGQNVLSAVQQVLADQPDEAAAVADRLEKELRQLLAGRHKLGPAPAEPRTEQRRR
jgi:hypothetical protein